MVTYLKRRVISAICIVRAYMLQNVCKTFAKRLTEVVRQNGGPIDHL